MVGNNTRRDEGSFTIRNNNVFSALESLRKKKKSDKEKKSKGSSKAPAKVPEPRVFWAPTPLSSKSWADVDDEDDDDYYATTAPPPINWTSQDAQGSKEVVDAVEESESEDDMLDLGDEDVEDEHEQEQEVIHPEPVANKVPETSLPVKEAERQLSKKERKKKELEELDALLADFGVTQKESDVQITGDAQQEKEAAEAKKEEANGNGDNVSAPSESKNAKKKKKKDKSAKEAKETTQEQPESSDVNGEQLNEEDMKERLKKIAAMKKKKTGKDLDGAAKAAAQEAAARNARLAAGKKKEKNHYNQQPVR